jgi:hypothetical protein
MADGSELIVLAPGVSQFGEDGQIDQLIRKYGYMGTAGILDAVQKNDDLRENLSAAAHLIHGSSEDTRFVRGAIYYHVLPRKAEQTGNRSGQLRVCGAGGNEKQI